MKAFEFLLLSLTLAGYLDLLFALRRLGAGPLMAGLGASVATFHQFWTLILAAEQRVLVLLGAGQIFSTLDENVGQAAVTFGLDVDDTHRTLSLVTFANGAPMRTSLGPRFQTLQLTLLAIGSSLTIHCKIRVYHRVSAYLDIILRPPDPVTVPGACAVLTRQLAPTFSAT